MSEIEESELGLSPATAEQASPQVRIRLLSSSDTQGNLRLGRSILQLWGKIIAMSFEYQNLTFSCSSCGTSSRRKVATDREFSLSTSCSYFPATACAALLKKGIGVQVAECRQRNAQDSVRRRCLNSSPRGNYWGAFWCDDGARQSDLQRTIEFAMPAQSRAKARRAACELSIRLCRFCCHFSPPTRQGRSPHCRVSSVTSA